MQRKGFYINELCKDWFKPISPSSFIYIFLSGGFLQLSRAKAKPKALRRWASWAWWRQGFRRGFGFTLTTRSLSVTTFLKRSSAVANFAPWYSKSTSTSASHGIFRVANYSKSLVSNIMDDLYLKKTEALKK